ncbi:MAG: superoxide dismutase family protein [Ekhidna sp.]|uniref:superoxide dismutase family protein n=1 Tax=Ekhidna sp. TaxID=2608089 RepID=UPI0032EB8431
MTNKFSIPIRPLSLLLLLTLACEDEMTPGPKTHAAADIYLVSTEDGETYSKGEWTGNASFEYQDGVTTLEVNLSGMVPGSLHAMHLHQGTLEQPGRHWNQEQFVSFCTKRSLGEIWAKTFAGDIGNIEIDEEGNGFFTIQTDLWSLGTQDSTDISGTVLFVHENFEDFPNECDPFHGHDHPHINTKIAGGTVVLGSELLTAN